MWSENAKKSQYEMLASNSLVVGAKSFSLGSTNNILFESMKFFPFINK
jgi:hypothetical protein